MKKLAILLVCAAMLASCNGLGGGSKDLKAENDSLLMELTQRNAELDEMMGTFNEVQGQTGGSWRVACPSAIFRR